MKKTSWAKDGGYAIIKAAAENRGKMGRQRRNVKIPTLQQNTSLLTDRLSSWDKEDLMKF